MRMLRAPALHFLVSGACLLALSHAWRPGDVEPLDDDIKLVVRFSTVGQKRLRAKYARLEPA